ncbi:MAG: tandem-95 repeat protein, partial [Bacteroidetes bacterium]|nr:tandem-95 repeat protein [Bacteroidota bacterium]
MKRLFPLLFLLVLIGAITRTPTAQDQGMAKTADGSFILFARNDTVLISINTTVDIDVLANDEDTNPGAVIFLEDDFILEPDHGTATVERSGTGNDFIRYEPDEDFAGVDSLIYEISNNFEADEEATVLIFINEPPVGNPDDFRVLPNRATQLDVLDNDTDADGDPLALESLFRVPLHGGAGIATVDETDVIVYTPTANFVGRDSLRYVVTDGKEGRDTTSVQLVVNTPPVAVVDSATTLPRTAVDIKVLENDTDADGDELTIVSIVDQADRGTAILINDGAEIRYTPSAGLTGTDSFQYAIVDPQGGGDTTTVIVQVNTPPEAEDDEATTVLETPIEIDVLDNDTDPEDNPLTVVSVGEPENGTAEIIDGGDRIRYTPDDEFIGTDTFDYTISDGKGGEDQATVTVVVLGNAQVQFIHNALPANPVDIYANGTRVVDDLAFQTATPYLDIIGGEVTVDVTDAEATNNSDPFFSTTLSFAPTEAYVAIATGVVEQNFSFVVKEDAHITSPLGFMDFFVAHGVLDAAASGIDVRVLDPLNSNLPSQVLADNLNFEEITEYVSRSPGAYNIEVSTADNGTQIGVSKTLVAGSATSDATTNTNAIGKYCWRAEYSGDSFYLSS